MRQFATGATRDSDADKPDYEGFLSPLVVEAFGQYMHKHRKQADGKLRDSDNWQKGMPRDAYMKSGWRHFMDWWKAHRGLPSREGLVDALCALLFNVQGYLHEVLKEQADADQWEMLMLESGKEKQLELPFKETPFARKQRLCREGTAAAAKQRAIALAAEQAKAA